MIWFAFALISESSNQALLECIHRSNFLYNFTRLAAARLCVVPGYHLRLALHGSLWDLAITRDCCCMALCGTWQLLTLLAILALCIMCISRCIVGYSQMVYGIMNRFLIEIFRPKNFVIWNDWTLKPDSYFLSVTLWFRVMLYYMCQSLSW